MATGERAAVERITLRDGRSLGYGEFGHPDGKPVFLFHSWLGSRLDAKFLDESAAKAGIRAIGIDRPGMGLSDFQFGRQILDWPEDVIQLADQLGIEQFAVSGVSGGGPYAAACAYKIPQRMTACHIIAGLGPISLGTEGMNTNNRALFFLAQRLPWLLRPVLWLSIGRLARFPAGVSSIHAEGIRDWLGLMSVGDWRDRFHTSADGVRELLEFTRTRRGNLLSALLLEGSVRTSLSVQTSESKPLEVTLGRNVFDVAVLELRAEATGQRLELTGSAPANLVPVFETGLPMRLVLHQGELEIMLR